MENVDLENALRLALDAISKGPPSSLKAAMEFIGSSHGIALPPAPVATIIEHVKTCGPNDATLDALTLAIHAWDHSDGAWGERLGAHSAERRTLILNRLGLSAAQQYTVNARVLLVSEADLPIVIAKGHEPWYDEIRAGRSFYWEHYTNQLLPPAGKWKKKEAELLGYSIDDVVSRLSDPCRLEIHGVKGLVVGYVQSGKTAHFSGLIAKASDAGYRLVIVLAGTLDILRRQTQRRLDKEIVGRELLTAEEYGQDSEWNSFVTHGGRPSEEGAFDWERLTNSDDDYKTLKRRLSSLEFRGADRTRPYNDAANLRQAPARLVVIKKTPNRLAQLCDDLEQTKGLKSRLEHVPTLVIDDESDQASVNTINQDKPGQRGERTSTNREIARLLRLLPRAQYVGYTATPFANVFIDPDDADDLFPRDFIISLRRPENYMGVSDFFDFGMEYEPDDVASNQRSFVRAVEGDNANKENLPRAIDSFVLAGAIKLFRQNADPDQFRFRHHTMLIHHASMQVVHDADKEEIERIFRGGARYHSKAGVSGLEVLFKEDFARVTKARAPEAPRIKSFEALKPFISECITRLVADKPVRIVNGDGRHKDDTPDFDATPVWAILVGGTKLSRGYTVEGLTVSYYRRPTGAGDTLMQMGRWFGFRPGYKDLVRLFIGRKERKGKKIIDLYEAFGAVCRDEEALRDDLRKYASEGLQPWQVPPLVRQHLPDLPPTSRNKMFNAEIASIDYAGHWTEKTSAPTTPRAIRENAVLADVLLESAALSASTRVTFLNEAGKKRDFSAYLGRAVGEHVYDFLKGYQWADGRRPIQHELEYLRSKLDEGEYQTWTILLPQVKIGVLDEHVLPSGTKVSVIARTRVTDTRFGVYSEPRHVDAAKGLAGTANVSSANVAMARAVSKGTPVMVLYFVAEIEGEGGDDDSVGFGIQYPGKKVNAPLQWTARSKDQDGQVVVPAPARARLTKDKSGDGTKH